MTKYYPVHASRLERWLGAEKIAKMQADMRGWYGRPICLLDVPGSVWVTADGDFISPIKNFERGSYMSAIDALEVHLKKEAREQAVNRREWFNHPVGRYIAKRHKPEPEYASLSAGFTSISDALARASQGYSQRRPFFKSGPTGVVGVSSSHWRVGTQPAAGTAPAAAPGGTGFSSSSTGALAFANPASGTNHLVGADAATANATTNVLVYDLIFGAAKTMNSTATEAVTGVPTRYQSTTATDADYIGDNFLFIQVGGTALAATAHNWTTCTYTDQANAASTLPSLTGNSGAIVDRLDHPAGQWFAPLESGDVGIKALTQMQCSAAVATGVIWFMIGHPLGILNFPAINIVYPYDWLTNRDQAPRVFDNACVAFLEMLKPSTTATAVTGRIITTSAAA